MADDPKECVQECPARSKKAEKAARKKSCAEIFEKINELTDREKKGGEGGAKGLLQRFRDYKGDDLTHGPEIQKQQRSLSTWIDEYIKKGCGEPPPTAVEVSQRPLPKPTSAAEPSQPGGISDGTKAGVAAAATVGAGYVAYRVIRFLPSLAPPLWWTIPENIAIP
jgi:hypothetical protein